jgi:hypothetical protein
MKKDLRSQKAKVSRTSGGRKRQRMEKQNARQKQRSGAGRKRGR